MNLAAIDVAICEWLQLDELQLLALSDNRQQRMSSATLVMHSVRVWIATRCHENASAVPLLQLVIEGRTAQSEGRA